MCPWPLVWFLFDTVRECNYISWQVELTISKFPPFNRLQFLITNFSTLCRWNWFLWNNNIHVTRKETISNYVSKPISNLLIQWLEYLWVGLEQTWTTGDSTYQMPPTSHLLWFCSLRQVTTRGGITKSHIYRPVGCIWLIGSHIL